MSYSAVGYPPPGAIMTAPPPVFVDALTGKSFPTLEARMAFVEERQKEFARGQKMAGVMAATKSVPLTTKSGGNLTPSSTPAEWSFWSDNRNKFLVGGGVAALLVLVLVLKK